MELELWNDIASVSAPAWWIPTLIGTTVVGLAIFVIALVRGNAYERTRDDERARNPFDSLGAFGIAVVIFGGMIGPGIATSYGLYHREDVIEDLVAEYLYNELDLTAMSPVEYTRPTGSEKRHGVTTTAVRHSGELVEVVVTWHDAKSRPHNSQWEIPDGFDPVDVQVTPPN